MREPRAPGAVRVGCSGWSYKDWRGIVYPAGIPQRQWFEHYQSLFDTVELNSTFYRLPAPETVATCGFGGRVAVLLASRFVKMRGPYDLRAIFK